MSTIRFLGTCSGTEPFENMHHTSFVIEANGRVYWFDAGEGCSRTAFLSGVDILSVNSVFISHPHEDHIGGLFNLFLLMSQQMWQRNSKMTDEYVNLFVPCEKLWEHIKGLISVAAGPGFFEGVDIRENLISDGSVFENEDIKVSALHNLHLPNAEGKDWHSYSFKIDADGKKIVYSGDIRMLCELDPLLEDGCDYLIIESGHHKVAEILEYAEMKGIENLIFNHHGREIINDREAMENLVKSYSHNSVIAYDGMAVEI